MSNGPVMEEAGICIIDLSLRSQVDAVKGRLGTMTGKIDVMDDKMGAIKEQIEWKRGAMDAKVDAMKGQLDQILQLLALGTVDF